MGSEIDPVPAMDRVGGGGREGNVCPPAISPPPLLSLIPPPSRATGMTSGSTPPGWKEGRGRSER